MEELKKLAKEAVEVVDYYNFPEELFIAGYQKAWEVQKSDKWLSQEMYNVIKKEIDKEDLDLSLLEQAINGIPQEQFNTITRYGIIADVYKRLREMGFQLSRIEEAQKPNTDLLKLATEFKDFLHKDDISLHDIRGKASELIGAIYIRSDKQKQPAMSFVYCQSQIEGDQSEKCKTQCLDCMETQDRNLDRVNEFNENQQQTFAMSLEECSTYDTLPDDERDRMYDWAESIIEKQSNEFAETNKTAIRTRWNDQHIEVQYMIIGAMVDFALQYANQFREEQKWVSVDEFEVLFEKYCLYFEHKDSPNPVKALTLPFFKALISEINQFIKK